MARSIALRIALAAVLAGCSPDSDVSRTLGARCDGAADCDDRCLSPSAAFPGGFCTVSCVTSGECPGGASCIADETGFCLFDCVDDRGCEFLGEGWRCRSLPLREDSSRMVSVCSGG